MESENSDNDPLIGTLIDGKYRIVSRIGGGGMGVVYKATHELMARTVAMKLLHHNIVGSQNEQQFLERFHREARASARMEHPNAVTIHDFGMHDGSPYLVMQYVEGDTLRAIIKSEGPLPLERIVPLMVQVCSAVHEAHQLGIIHRDLKPDNIMVSPKGDGSERAVVLDFGIAKLVGSEDTSVTQTGNIIGTPQYMAPERMRGAGALDARSDLYAIGVILYEMCTGVVPFKADSAVGLMMKHLSEPPAPFSRHSIPHTIPPVMEATIMRALEKDPGKRPQSLRELADELEAIAREHIPGFSTGSFRSDTATNSMITMPAITVDTAPRKKLPVKAVLGAVVGAAVLLGAFLLLRSSGDDEQKVQVVQVDTRQDDVRQGEQKVEEQAQPAQDQPEARTLEQPEQQTQQPAEAKAPPPLSPQAAALMSEAQAAQKEGRTEEAELLYKRLLIEAPEQASAFHELGDLYLGSSRLEDAIVMLTRATELAPNDAAAFSKLGYAHGQLGRLDDAIAAYKETIRLKPEYALAYNNLGYSYLRSGKLDEAEQAFKECLRRDKRYARAFFNLAEVYRRRGDWDRAILAHSGGISADPNNPPAYIALGEAYEKAGRPEKAIEAYQAALKLKPDYRKATEKLQALGVR